MVKAFWILAGLNAAGLLLLLVLGLREKGHNDGGREMGLVFYVLLPLLVLGLVVAVFHFVPVTLVRWLCLAVAALPLAFYGYVAVARIGLTFVNSPANNYTDPNMKKLMSAVDKLDVDAVRRLAPLMDKTVDQGQPFAPLRLVIDKMVQEQKTRLPARVEPHLAILKTLLENGARPNEALLVACWTRSGELFSYMFQAGADPNYRDQYSGPVFFSCLDGGIGVPGPALPMVKEFVAAGVDVNVRSNSGFLPAAYAASCGQFDAALHLLDHGADPDARDGAGQNLRDVVAKKAAELGAAAPEDLKQLAARLASNSRSSAARPKA